MWAGFLPMSCTRSSLRSSWRLERSWKMGDCDARSWHCCHASISNVRALVVFCKRLKEAVEVQVASDCCGGNNATCSEAWSRLSRDEPSAARSNSVARVNLWLYCKTQLLIARQWTNSWLAGGGHQVRGTGVVRNENWFVVGRSFQRWSRRREWSLKTAHNHWATSVLDSEAWSTLAVSWLFPSMRWEGDWVATRLCDKQTIGGGRWKETGKKMVG